MSPCPSALSSETDILVPPEDVRAFAESRARADDRVELRPFADAPHVELLRMCAPAEERATDGK